MAVASNRARVIIEKDGDTNKRARQRERERERALRPIGENKYLECTNESTTNKKRSTDIPTLKVTTRRVRVIRSLSSYRREFQQKTLRM